MQRLFSTFPNSWPGIGLILMRLSLAFSVFISADQHLILCCRLFATVQEYAGLGLAASLLLGIATPFAAAAMSAVFVWRACGDSGLSGHYLSLGAISLALVMIGPGAWSLDAVFFGRKRIEVRHR